ncbi:nitrosoguanidine resistance protein [Rhodotorula toruloides]|uniref:BY PROTMAP: gi/472585561/gb/EMS23112.1/ nitrosoguanidine resistance protein [Rhodosporidium toruloides NP11] gi/647400756/emb/CDR46497.1/ RHTO0S12e05160g1_1 [Rhodosporidium toruloides] n=1 Tax=Rhodotorula toruloides TaxID=5286 RepID=A0A0K3CTT6_RHOTO|nr:nitrosoguanidine resistance protein [Rhodotorula toruloides]PRQ70656.1 Protein of unknown function (DUF3533)-domain containing protein [Rhodotorula toruloides]
MSGGIYDVEKARTDPAGASVAAGGGAGRPSQRPDPVRLALKKLIPAGSLFLPVFFITALWMYGALYQTSQHAHNLNVLVIDFDGGSVGAALLAAVRSLNGQKTLPTFVIANASSITHDEALHTVFDGEYWGAVFATEGATNRFEAALAGGSAAAAYNASQGLEYSGLEVRYPSAWSGVVLSALLRVLQTTAHIFNAQTVAPLLASGTALTPPAAQVVVNPLGSTYINLTPFSFGSRIVLNTIGFVYPFLFQFFFLLALNGIFTTSGAYRNLSLKRHLTLRLCISIPWTLATSLCVASWAVMFDESYDIKAKNFFALWAVLWIFSTITFDTFDILTTWVPPAFLAYLTINVIIMSVSAVIWPIELANRFYRIHYVFPSHATWSTMITIFGNGTVNRLYRDLPILAAWLVVLKCGVVLSLRKRAREGVAVAGGTAVAPPTQSAGERKAAPSARSLWDEEK